MFPTLTSFPYFVDLSGFPLTGGKLYIGTPNLNPETNQITVYWDIAGTIPAAQPILTSNGYPVRNGTPATVYVPANFSITAKDKNGKLLFSKPTSTELEMITGTLGAIGGAALVMFLQAGAGAVSRSVQDKERDFISVKDFGATGDGSTDDTAAIYLAKQRATGLIYPAGNYRINAFTNPATSPRISRGEGTVNLNWYYLSAIAWANFPSDTIWENIRFVCTEGKAWLRASIEGADRVTLRNCHIKNFLLIDCV